MYIYHNILKYTLDGSTQIQHFCANKASGGGCSKWDASMMINSKGLAGCGSPFRKGETILYSYGPLPTISVWLL